MDDHMEIGETNLISTRYGFYNIATEQHFDAQMNEINEATIMEILDDVEDSEA